jgi:acyl carrier protein
MSDVRERVQAIFRDVFDDDDLVLSDGMTAAEVDGWDSLAHINLIIAIEQKLGVKFATAEISRLKEHGQNVGSFLKLIEGKMTGRA